MREEIVKLLERENKLSDDALREIKNIEIDDFDVPVAGQHHIIGIDIPMNDVLIMQKAQPIAYLSDDPLGLRLREDALTF